MKEVAKPSDQPSASVLPSGILLKQIVDALGGELHGDGDRVIHRIAPLRSASSDAITFLAQSKYAAQLPDLEAGCVIIKPQMQLQVRAGMTCITTHDPYAYYARLTQWWLKQWKAQQVNQMDHPRVHPTAVIDPMAQIDKSCSIGAFAVIGARAKIGPHTHIHAHVTIGEDALIGEHTLLYPHVNIGDRCSVGDRCVIHAGAVIGADGFGFAPEQGHWVKIEQLGGVVIGNDVEIGAQTCIDRGALGDTVIEDGVKLDNLIQVAHNVRIGRGTAMAACSAIAGSTTIGAHCTIAGGAGVVGHLEVADNVHISAYTLVTRSIREPGVYTGVFPMDDNASWERNAATLRHLYALRNRVKTLEQDK